MLVDHQALSERYAAALASGDLEIIDEIFTEDFVDEYPQSGEIIRGRANLRGIMEHRPGLPSERGPDLSTVRSRASDEHRVLAPLFTVVRVQGRGDAGTTTLRARYPDRRRLRAARRPVRPIHQLLRAPVRASGVASPVRRAAGVPGRLTGRTSDQPMI